MELDIAVETHIVVVLSVRPEHAAGGLVADLDPGRRDTGITQGGQHIGRMIRDGLHKRLERQVFPGSRFVLLARIGPGIAVVEINHHLHAKGLGPAGLRHHIFLTAPAVLGIDPDPQPDGVHAKRLEQGHAFHLLTLGRIELAAFLLHLCQPAHIGPLGKIEYDRLRLGFRFGFRSFATGRHQDGGRKKKYKKLFHSLVFVSTYKDSN